MQAQAVDDGTCELGWAWAEMGDGRGGEKSVMDNAGPREMLPESGRRVGELERDGRRAAGRGRRAPGKWTPSMMKWRRMDETRPPTKELQVFCLLRQQAGTGAGYLLQVGRGWR